MRRNAFTLVELIIGMVMTAMVLSALSVVTYAVSNGWQSAVAADSTSITGSQVQTRLTQYFRPAATLGAFQHGTLGSSSNPASVFFWKADLTSTTYPTGDGKIEFNEIGLLRYEPTSQELRLYDASDWNTWSTSSQNAANAIAGTTYISSTLNMSDFMSACPHYRVVMRNVTGVLLNTDTTSDKPLMEYLVQLTDSSGQSSMHYGTITLRAPMAPAN
ncbi:hypothetical protein BH10PLA1_BH10PLA1_02640 [soil metagenome]